MLISVASIERGQTNEDLARANRTNTKSLVDVNELHQNCRDLQTSEPDDS